jgi:beta-N-acetylhexosaminidase
MQSCGVISNWRRGRIPRRRFLQGLGSTIGLALLAACGVPIVSPSPSPTSTPPPTASPTPAPTPLPTVEPPSLRAKIAQMLLVGFRGATPAEAASTIAEIGDLGLGGVLLFSRDVPSGSDIRNVVSPDQLRTLVGALRAAAPGSPAGQPLLVTIDQEGGQVARLAPARGFPATRSAAELGAIGDPVVTRTAGLGIGQTLAAAGITVDLAPVVDVNVNPDNPIIGAVDRSFSADPAQVTVQAGAFIEGLHDATVLSTLKHFPGHGSSTGDTHLGVVDVTATWSAAELAPFADLIGSGLADSVLTAHVFNATLDPDYPATLSHATITGLLREQLGWDGLVLSDDMQMGAIRDAFGYRDAVRLAINAGVDVLTIANQLVFEEGIVPRTIDLIEGLVTDGSITPERIDQSWRRIVAFKAGMA